MGFKLFETNSKIIEISFQMSQNHQKCHKIIKNVTKSSKMSQNRQINFENDEILHKRTV
jgi:hypothetical protein